MPSLSKRSRPKKFELRKYSGVPIVGVVFAMFFFLPEILSFESEEQGVDQSSVANLSEVIEDEQELPQVEEELLTLAAQQGEAEGAVLGEEPAEVEEIQEVSTIEEVVPGETELVPGPDCSRCFPADGTVVEAEESKYLLPINQPITWQALSQEKVQAELARSAQVSQHLLQTLGKDDLLTKTALKSFIDGIQTVRKGPENGVFGPEEAVRALDILDRNVTFASSRDGLSRSFLLKWSEVSLEPLIRESMAARAKAQALARNRPEVYVTRVRHILRLERRDKVVPGDIPDVDLEGMVLGSGIRSIRLYENNELKTPVGVHMRSIPNVEGVKFVTTADIVDGAAKDLILEVTDEAGNVFVKGYRFRKPGPSPQFYIQGPYYVYDSQVALTNRSLDPRFAAGPIRPIPGEKEFGPGAPSYAVPVSYRESSPSPARTTFGSPRSSSVSFSSGNDSSSGFVSF